ncbi:zinc finger and SCAN domain-containing protein 2-like [Sitodiplosis mosellana]|uniref:zinc finger and SCAN domain-containing protein 2-like n=1 Tax=Sitodiplosis mosellana TaxID=263140 RepID=UPI002444C970|nr:zinc finger and SCAN domain-containing protein 2-like [Sitodiplosis mosellana]
METADCVLDDELLVANDDFICNFCSLEFPNSLARTEHTLQHFRQAVCSGCEETLICIGDVWYGPHSASNCCKANTDAVSEVQVSDEVILPDYIEIKQEEIVDIDDDEEEVRVYDEEEISIHDEESDLFGENELDENEPDEVDTIFDADEDQAIAEQYHVPTISAENELTTDRKIETESTKKCFKIVNKKFKVDLSNCKMTPIHHKNKCIGFKSEPRAKKLNHTPHEKKMIQTPQQQQEEKEDDLELTFDKEMLGGREVTLGLTQEQLNSRQCPICFKVIINRQNLICHMNIHSGDRPFVCDVCQKSFAHIRNLNRHKEQQGHSDFQFQCIVQGCGRHFMSSNKMNRHIKLDHQSNAIIIPQLPFECPHCRKAFSSIGYLRMHIKQGHRIS